MVTYPQVVRAPNPHRRIVYQFRGESPANLVQESIAIPNWLKSGVEESFAASDCGECTDRGDIGILIREEEGVDSDASFGKLVRGGPPERVCRGEEGAFFVRVVGCGVVPGRQLTGTVGRE